MSNVIQLRPSPPEDVHLCATCGQAEFLLWKDGTVMCAKCTVESERIKVVPK